MRRDLEIVFDTLDIQQNQLWVMGFLSIVKCKTFKRIKKIFVG